MGQCAPAGSAKKLGLRDIELQIWLNLPARSNENSKLEVSWMLLFQMPFLMFGRVGGPNLVCTVSDLDHSLRTRA